MLVRLVSVCASAVMAAHVRRRIDLGFVGPVPRDVRDLLTRAPEGSDIRVARSLFTVNQLENAPDKAISNRDPKVIEVSFLDKGRGIEVTTESRTLAFSHRPSWLLGVRVDVIARLGHVSPA